MTSPAEVQSQLIDTLCLDLVGPRPGFDGYARYQGPGRKAPILLRPAIKSVQRRAARHLLLSLRMLRVTDEKNSVPYSVSGRARGQRKEQCPLLLPSPSLPFSLSFEVEPAFAQGGGKRLFSDRHLREVLLGAGEVLDELIPPLEFEALTCEERIEPLHLVRIEKRSEHGQLLFIPAEVPGLAQPARDAVHEVVSFFRIRATSVDIIRHG